MQTTLAPGDRVRHPTRRDWGLGQVQTVDGARVTVNLDHAGKQLIDVAAVPPIESEPDWPCGSDALRDGRSGFLNVLLRMKLSKLLNQRDSSS